MWSLLRGIAARQNSMMMRTARRDCSSNSECDDGAGIAFMLLMGSGYGTYVFGQGVSRRLSNISAEHAFNQGQEFGNGIGCGDLFR